MMEEKSSAEKFRELLKSFDTAMLTTINNAGEMHSRPLAIAEVEPSGDILFFTDKASGKVFELEQRPQISISCQEGWKKSLTLRGNAELFRDTEKAKQIWRKTYQTWFPGGPDDPNLLMIRVRGEQGEYWDNSGLQGVKYMFKAVKAVATGTRPAPDSVEEHGRVKMR
jgi:general stress protein 26